MLRHLRLGNCILSHLHLPSSPRTPSTTPILQLHRLLSATATPFAVEDYLAATCHLTAAQALKASKALSHLKSPSKPDAVVAVLSGLGMSGADIAAAVAKDPKLLCCKVKGTLVPRLAELRDFGLTSSQIARLVAVAPKHFRLPTIVSKLQYYVPLLGGSFENLLRAVRANSYLLGFDLERVAKPNVALLKECGLDARDIARLSILNPKLITVNPECLRTLVERAKVLCVPQRPWLFIDALCTVMSLSDAKVSSKVELLTKMFRWSDAEVRAVVSKRPLMLRYSKDKLRRLSEFLITEVGLEPEYIAQRPTVLTYSLERRHMPRYYVVKFLKDNGLLLHALSYYATVTVSDNDFMNKFILPYKEAAPNLDQYYAAACRAQVPITL